MNRKLTAVLSAAAIAGLAAPLSAAPATAATTSVGVSATAYGTYVVVGGLVRSGPTALASIGCTTAFGRTVTGSTGGVNVPSAASVGATSTSASTAQSASGLSSRASSSTAAVNLLGGLVRADSVSSTSSAARSTTGVLTGANQAQLVGLKVGGQSLNAVPAPNSAISLKTSTGAALATVYLNQQSKALVGNDLQVSTVALRVVVTGSNTLGLAIGSRIDVGVSRTTLSKPILGLVGGMGYATSANLANGAVSSSRTALAYPPCTGGSSKATLATAGVPGVVETGSTTTDTVATITSTSRRSYVKNAIAGPRVLGGLISADTIIAETSASQAAPGAVPVVSDTSRFVGLRIAGLPAISSSVKPNTVITVPGLGRVTLHKVVRTPKSVDVVMIEVVTDRLLGSLPTGSVIRIGASATTVI